MDNENPYVVRIHQELDRIEKEENVKILFAAESGSRAWGFPAADSDYDVRFIYTRPYTEYLKLNRQRDVIEFMSEDRMLDINGWDLDKALKLLYKGNPTFFEWLNSGIIYREDLLFQFIRSEAPKHFLNKPALYHYISMADGNFKDYMVGDKVKLKKYFYVVRPILAAEHVLQTGTPPPILFSDLLNMYLPGSEDDEPITLAHRARSNVDNLFKIREDQNEKVLIDRRTCLDHWIKETIDITRAKIKQMNEPKDKSWDKLNDIFYFILSSIKVNTDQQQLLDNIIKKFQARRITTEDIYQYAGLMNMCTLYGTFKEV